MTGVAVALLMAAGCTGLGAVVLAVLGVAHDLNPRETLAWSFVTGMGCLGWLMFPAFNIGITGPLPLAFLLMACSVGVLALRGRVRSPFQGLSFSDPTTAILTGLLFVALVFDIFEGISPAADADTLGYHFNLPKRFIEQGRIEYVPIAIQNAIPLLTHMTYLPALAIGGEVALTLWTGLSGWLVGLLLFGLCRRYVSTNWSLALTLVYLTTPAVVYGAGSGQVEARAAGFVLIAAAAAAAAYQDRRWQWCVVAGLGAGCYMGSKYIGLLFVAAVGLVLLASRGGIRRAVPFALAAMLAGGPWYVWNWQHTGDPVFPLLYDLVPYSPDVQWTAAHSQGFKERFVSEVPLEPSLWLILTYPFKATLAAPPVWEAGRTGFGALGLLLLPFVLFSLVRYRRNVLSSPLLIIFAVLMLFYTLWIVTAPAQRVRHLLPVYPLFVLCAGVAAQRFTLIHPVDARSASLPLFAAIGVTIAVQIGGHLVFSTNYMRHIVTGEDRTAFLLRNVAEYGVVPWLNANLGDEDRLVHVMRQLSYNIDRNNYFADADAQAAIDVTRLSPYDAAKFWEQIRSLGVTHILIPGTIEAASASRNLRFQRYTHDLFRSNCIEFVKRFRLRRIRSRTLANWGGSTYQADLLRLRGNRCDVVSPTR